jgi:hypothetical protein
MLPRRNPATEPNALDIREGSVHPEPVDILVEEVTLTRSQVMEAISQLVSAIDRDRVARQLVEGTGCSLKDFYSHHSKSFDGKGDHTGAENWMNDVEELLATLGCTNEQKVAYAAYQTGEAKWWLSLTWVQRLQFLGKSSSTSSIGTSFLESCRR